MCTYLDFLNRFRELLDENDSSQAVRLAGAMVAKYPSSLALLEHWALALWKDGRFSEASDVLLDAETLGELSTTACTSPRLPNRLTRKFLSNWKMRSKPFQCGLKRALR
jgi:hypothetical protein